MASINSLKAVTQNGRSVRVAMVPNALESGAIYYNAVLLVNGKDAGALAAGTDARTVMHEAAVRFLDTVGERGWMHE